MELGSHRLVLKYTITISNRRCRWKEQLQQGEQEKKEEQVKKKERKEHTKGDTFACIFQRIFENHH